MFPTGLLLLEAGISRRGPARGRVRVSPSPLGHCASQCLCDHILCPHSVVQSILYRHEMFAERWSHCDGRSPSHVGVLLSHQSEVLLVDHAIHVEACASRCVQLEDFRPFPCRALHPCAQFCWHGAVRDVCCAMQSL